MPTQAFMNYHALFCSLKKLPRTLRLIWQIKKNDVVFIVLLSCIQGVCPVLSLLISQQLINAVASGNQTIDYIFSIFVFYVVFNLFATSVGLALELIQGRFQTLVRYKLNYMIMTHCSNLELADFENAETYDLIEKLTSEVAVQPNEVFRAIIALFTSCITLITAMVIIFVWKPFFGVILLLLPLVCMSFYLKVGQMQFAVAWGRAKQEREAWYLSHLLTHDFSFKELKIFGLRNHFLHKYWNLSERFIQQNNRMLRQKVIYESAYEGIMQLLSAAILVVAIRETVLARLLIGNLMTIIRSLSMIEASAQQILNGLYTIYHSNLYMDKLFDFIQEKPNKKQKSLLPAPLCMNEIRIQNLSFTYPSATKKALSNVNLTIKKGQSLAIVGENGSGKSTLLKLLSGLYTPRPQTIFLNETDLGTIDIANYQKQVSVLFQDFVKYEMTLRENVAFGELQNLNNTAKIEATVQGVELPDFADNLEQQLGNWFNEGRQLSQGQWQRLALARSLFRESQIYILDEPNAALDSISEKKIMEYFIQYAHAKICIFITHKIASAKLADKVLVMDHGTIVGYDSHEMLLRQNKKYQELWRNEHYE